MRRPGDSDTAEGFGDEEAVPGTQHPGALRLQMKCANVGPDSICERSHTRFGDHVWTAWPIGSEGADVAIAVGGLHGKQTNCSATGARAPHRLEAETFDGACDQLAIEGLRDKDGDP